MRGRLLPAAREATHEDDCSLQRARGTRGHLLQRAIDGCGRMSFGMHPEARRRSRVQIAGLRRRSNSIATRRRSTRSVSQARTTVCSEGDQAKMNRRFVNLVVANNKSRMYSLHRLDVAKHLFYPSTAEAEVANENGNNNGGKPQRIEKLRRLPSPSLHLQPYFTDGWWSRGDMFSLLRPGGGSDGEAGRILHTNENGHAILCDAGSCSAKTLPSLNEPKGWDPISFTVPGAGGESIYVMRSNHRPHNLEILYLGPGCREPLQEFKWQPLPPPPFGRDGNRWVRSSTLLDDGRIICVSAIGYCMEMHMHIGGTYCFDTESEEWWEAGDWFLPFDGRAVHVPELDTWLGFSPDNPHHLCAMDLSSVAMAPRQAPTRAHVWEDLNPPPWEKTSIVLKRRFPGTVHTTKEWQPMECNLVNLGSGRFCIAKFFNMRQTVKLSYSFEEKSKTVGEFAVLTGVEVDRGGEGGGLRMVKHKSKRYMFTSDYSIKAVL
ncbi:hypothetical protein EJB05_15228 [Eragrostis curvula]|uniref:Uncharacterized protein n=1 Tax=Eragrostis curvula TaxID=38414 RepID=A0A5J9W192_9POAL|nr:hypothetical protein EJB05_15228 [Eragrostis curvula]